ncbi:MAG: hypothetical protein HQM03_04455 [Magnetococcales bacterium]|nr:hypothetical protein [Magnetococcales bacterium]
MTTMSHQGQIHQLQASYSVEQDRVLLRVSTSDHAEYRFWLTRRFIQRLWEGLRHHLETRHRIAESDPKARAALLEFMHQSATAQVDFASPYQEDSETVTPLGREPILVTRATLGVAPEQEELVRLGLNPAEGEGLELTLDTQLMHGFCKLLAEAMSHAEWDLDLGFINFDPLPVLSEQGGQVLH